MKTFLVFFIIALITVQVVDLLVKNQWFTSKPKILKALFRSFSFIIIMAFLIFLSDQLNLVE